MNLRLAHTTSAAPATRDVTQPLRAAGMHSGTDHAARWASGPGGGYDANPSLPEGKDLGAGDAVVVGQVETGSDIIVTRGSRLGQDSQLLT